MPSSGCEKAKTSYLCSLISLLARLPPPPIPPSGCLPPRRRPRHPRRARRSAAALPPRPRGRPGGEQISDDHQPDHVRPFFAL